MTKVNNELAVQIRKLDSFNNNIIMKYAWSILDYSCFFPDRGHFCAHKQNSLSSWGIQCYFQAKMMQLFSWVKKVGCLYHMGEKKHDRLCVCVTLKCWIASNNASRKNNLKLQQHSSLKNEKQVLLLVHKLVLMDRTSMIFHLDSWFINF